MECKEGWVFPTLDGQSLFCQTRSHEFEQSAICQQFRRLVLLYRGGEGAFAAALKRAAITSFAAGRPLRFFCVPQEPGFGKAAP